MKDATHLRVFKENMLVLINKFVIPHALWSLEIHKHLWVRWSPRQGFSSRRHPQSQKRKDVAGLEVIGHWFNQSWCCIMTVHTVLFKTCQDCTVSVSKASYLPEPRSAVRPVKLDSVWGFILVFITVVFFHGFQLSVRSPTTYGKIQTSFQIQYKGNYIPHSGIVVTCL